MILFQNGHVISMDPGRPRTERCDILIDGDRIRDMGRITPSEGVEVIDASRMILLPGLVNAHLHTWQTNLRGMAGNWTFGRYLQAMHQGLATAYQPEDIALSNRIGAMTQIHGGTTTLVDWCHNNPTPEHTDAAIDGLRAAGIRAVFMHGSPKPAPAPGQRPYSEIPMSRSEVERLAKAELGPLIDLGLAILGPRDSTFEVSVEDLKLAREFGLVASAHTGGRPFMYDGAIMRLAAEGLIDGKVNFVHANNFTDDELALFHDCGGTITTTAEVELSMGFGRPLTGRWRDLGGDLSIGTDVEPACGADMFASMRMTLQYQRDEDYRAAATAAVPLDESKLLTGYDALGWATMGGARMLGLEDRIGSLAPGKAADLIAFDCDDPLLAPVLDPIATVVLHAGPSQVETVMIAGRFVKRHGRLVQAIARSDTEAMEQSAKRIIATAGAQLD
ncbi:amidohydrolase family protein [Pseudooceanicola sp. C21-150M6]|uniref:amidohydrolase family protein n=1 Tax=Pseudooceanicola sp. C21-150M6 TaxID=3434355 RepID=UPI003D7F83FE